MANLNPMIGAKQTIMIGGEATRGEGLTTSTKNVLFPKNSGNLTPKLTFASDQSAHGTIVAGFSERLVDAYTDISLNGNFSFSNARTLIEALTGTTGETNTYTIKNDNTHKTFVISEITGDYLENGEVEIYSAPYCSLNTLNIDSKTGDFVKFDANFIGSKAEKVTKSQLQNKVKQQLTSEQARDKSSNNVDFSQVKVYIGEAATVNAFNEAITGGTILPLDSSSLSLRFNKNVEQIGKMGTFEKITYNKQFSIEGSFEKVKYQGSFDYDSNVNKDLKMRIDFHDVNKTKVIFSIILGKINLVEKTTNDDVASLVSENITFRGLFSGTQNETLIINTPELASVESA